MEQDNKCRAVTKKVLQFCLQNRGCETMISPEKNEEYDRKQFIKAMRNFYKFNDKRIKELKLGLPEIENPEQASDLKNIIGSLENIQKQMKITFPSERFEPFTLLDIFIERFTVKILFLNQPLQVAKSQSHNLQDNSSPPVMGKFLICLFLPKNIRENVLGCLEEDYHSNCKQVGTRYAKVLYCKEVFFSIWPMLYTKLKQAGAIALFEEFIRRVLF